MPLTERGPFLLVYALSQLTGRLLAGYLAGSGLTPGDYAIYSLVLVEGQVTPTRMAEALGLPPTTVSYTVRQMQSRGHLRRIPNPHDGRSHLLELTPRGRQMTQAAARGFAQALEAFRRNFEMPEAKLLSTMEAMSAALESAVQEREVAAAS